MAPLAPLLGEATPVGRKVKPASPVGALFPVRTPAASPGATADEDCPAAPARARFGCAPAAAEDVDRAARPDAPPELPREATASAGSSARASETGAGVSARDDGWAADAVPGTGASSCSGDACYRPASSPATIGGIASRLCIRARHRCRASRSSSRSTAYATTYGHQGDGHRPRAGGRRAAATRLLWRHLDADDDGGARLRAECPYQSREPHQAGGAWPFVVVSCAWVAAAPGQEKRGNARGSPLGRPLEAEISSSEQVPQGAPWRLRRT